MCIQNCRDLLFILVLLPLLVGCEHNTPEIKAPKGEYFPTEIGSEWHYLSTHAYESDARSPVQKVVGDTIIDNFSYSQIVTTSKVDAVLTDDYTTFIRKENGNYYAKHPNYVGFTYRGEYIFLKDYEKVGAKWIHHINDQWFIEYKVASIGAQRKLDGKIYNNLIEIIENEYSTQSGKQELVSSVHKIYAKDIGLIFSEYEAFIYTSHGSTNLKRYFLQ